MGHGTQARWQIGALAEPSWGPVIDLGPEHPMRTGLVRLTGAVSQDRLTSLDVAPGWCHRGAEKLFEVRDARQVLMLADRHDWHAAFVGELVTALAAESLLGLMPPPRATMLRTLLAEQARIGSHLAFLSFLPWWYQRHETSAELRALRGAGRQVLMELSGNRVHPMLNRLGGLAMDASPEWVNHLETWMRSVEQVLGPLERLAERLSSDHPSLAAITEGVMNDFGLSGPIARAAGRGLDLRRSHPALAYPELDVPATPTTTGGDAGARFRQWCIEITDAITIVRAAIKALEPGPVDVELARIIRFPEGESWASVEAPQGRASVWLVARGQRTPWRLKLRTASFNTVSAWSAVLPGTPVDLLPVALASVPYTMGDLDK